MELFRAGWRCLEVLLVVFGAGWGCFGLEGAHLWLVPIGDFDIFRGFATRREMSRNVEKCRKMSSFVEFCRSRCWGRGTFLASIPIVLR